MPGFIARRLCPELILVPTNFEKYNYYSDLTRKGKQSCFKELQMHFVGFSSYSLVFTCFPC